MSSPAAGQSSAAAAVPAADTKPKFAQFSAEELANAPKLEPALEAVLRGARVDEHVISLFRVREILDREEFVNLHSSEEGMRQVVADPDAFGVNPEKGFVHAREMARIIKAWSNAKTQAETKQHVDNVAKAHGEPTTMLQVDWTTLLDRFKEKYGEHLHDNRLPSQSYYEAFEEKLSDGQLTAETLAHVVSLQEELDQKAKHPEPTRQLGLHLDSSLTIQTKRRYMSHMPSSTEQLRQKYKVMTHMWLLAQMRQPTRPLYSDLTKDTFNDLLEELLSTRNFLLERQVAGQQLVAPVWEHCLDYEYNIRKEAIERTRRRGLPIQQALWSVYRDESHRMEHWVTLLCQANAAPVSAPSGEMAAMRKELAELKRKLAQRGDRSRSPHRKGPPAVTYSQNTPLAIGDRANPKSKGKGKGQKNANKKGKAKSTASGSGTQRGFKTFSQIRTSPAARSGFVAQDKEGSGVCYRFQSNKPCVLTPCDKAHICIGCGKQNVPYDSCGCLNHLV